MSDYDSTELFERLKEFKEIIEKHPEGLNFSTLFHFLVNIEQESHLSLVIKQAIENKICNKINGMYYPANIVTIEPKKPNISEEIKNLMSKSTDVQRQLYKQESNADSGTTATTTRLIKTKQQLTVLPEQKSGIEKDKLLNGALRRKGVKGILAYCLWRCRGNSLTRDDLNIIFESVVPDSTQGSRYQAISSLVDSEMVRRHGQSSDYTYSWNELKYGYPFMRMDSEDKTLIPFNSYSEFVKWRDVRNNTAASTQITDNQFISKEEQPPISDYTVPIDKSPMVDLTRYDVLSFTNMKTPLVDTIKNATNEEAINFIELRISHYETELSFLKHLKQLLTKA